MGFAKKSNVLHNNNFKQYSFLITLVIIKLTYFNKTMKYNSSFSNFHSSVEESQLVNSSN